jgi:hypothetical protein
MTNVMISGSLTVPQVDGMNRTVLLTFPGDDPMNIPAPIQTWLEHVRVLSVDIGPRGSTTEGERRGAEYCRNALEKLGLQAVLEPFKSARSIFLPHLLASLLMLSAFFVYPLAGRLSAAAAFWISLVSFASQLLELGFKDNLFRRLVPKGQSQNALAILPAVGEHRQDLVLIGHLDTQRTPLIFRSKTWVDAYKTFTTVAFVFFAVQGLVFLSGWIFQWDWAWYVAIPSALCAVLLAGMCIQADLTPFTSGANDNATAAGLVLALAEQFLQTPLQHTRLFLVCTGCEEVQHYGAIDFFKRHRAEMVNPKALVFEMLGCAGPAWLAREGIIVPFHADPDLLRTVERLSQAHPEWGAYPTQINGGNTEMADCVRFNVPALTLFGLTPEGDAPYWHQMEDTFDKLDPEVMNRAYSMAVTLIRELDSEAG